jgi:peroxin-19
MLTDKAAPHRRRKKREDLNSILDAALDELDDDDSVRDGQDGDDDSSCGGEGGDDDGHDDFVCSRAECRVVDYPHSMGGSDHASSETIKRENDGIFAISEETWGVPYSLDYLAVMRRRAKEKAESGRRDKWSANNCNNDRPQFGPEPPPPRTTHEVASSLPSPLPFDFNAAAAAMGDESDLVASLEAMMKQFSEGMNVGEDFDLGDERVLDEMLKKMMVGTNGGFAGGDTNGGHIEKPSRPTYQSSLPAASASTDNKTKKAVPRKSNGSSVNINKVTKRKEPNVDESINRLLDGINQAASSSPRNNPPLPPHGMEGIDPSQLEQFSEEMMLSLMSDFEKMGNKNDSNIVVDNVMKQLLDKDLMYEPMREVCTRFPAYLAENKERLSQEEYIRYGKQYQYFQKIVHVYETEPDNFDRLMELMQDIQEYGQPPAEIIKELAPDLEFDEGGMPIGGGGGMMMPGMLPGMTSGGMAFPGPGVGNEQCCIS